MDAAIEKIIKELAEHPELKSESIKEESIRSVVRTAFAGLRQELLKMNFIRYEMPYFATFSANRKELVARAKKIKSTTLLDIAERRDKYRTLKPYYKDELSKARSEIEDSQLGESAEHLR